MLYWFLLNHYPQLILLICDEITIYLDSMKFRDKYNDIITKGSYIVLDKKKDKRIRDRDPSWGGSSEGGEGSKHQETLSPASLWGVLESQRAT